MIRLRAFLRTLFAVAITLVCSLANANDQPTTASLRILSLAPSLTETLYALGAEDQLVGVTDFCQYPAEARTKPRVGGLHDLRLEQVLALRPNLVFYFASTTDVLHELDKRGIETINVQAETIADVRAGILSMGERIGRGARAKELVKDFDARLAAVRQRAAASDPITVLFVVGHPPGVLREVYAAGPNTFLDELLALVGARNAMAGAAIRYPVVSREALMRQPPDVVIEHKPTGEPWTDEERAHLRTLWLEYLGPAAKGRTRVVMLDDPHVTIPGPAIPEQAELLFNAVR
ncbi:MAG: cobalamin transport system substrate-binding protein [Candidatus Sumerlaeota bacterium]|nr:cobalamin transport system substrate-binding protein [Candidatus Sumerlaeota bacterium]